LTPLGILAKTWAKCTQTYILKMFTVTFPICQLNDD
jgi:hypothetical protein